MGAHDGGVWGRWRPFPCLQLNEASAAASPRPFAGRCGNVVVTHQQDAQAVSLVLT